MMILDSGLLFLGHPVHLQCKLTVGWYWTTPTSSGRWIQKFWKEEGEATCLPRRHLSQMHTTNYMPFYTGKGCLFKQFLSQ